MKREPFVRSTFNYTLDDGNVPEIFFYEPEEPVEPHQPGNDPREMSVFDGWSRVDRFSLDREGFELQPFGYKFDRWSDNTAIETQLYPKVTEFIRKHVGAERVHIFDHTIRSKVNERKQTSEDSTTQRAPVLLVHCDFTPHSGPLRVRQILPDEADKLLQRRVAFYNFWLPFNNRVEEMPLAMCDATTSPDADLLKMILRYRDRTGEIFVMRHSEVHRWWYFPLMEPTQALLLKTYDSETDGRARFMGHSAFTDPTTPPDARTRSSIEIRTMAFF
jgi:hypothetical protein